MQPFGKLGGLRDVVVLAPFPMRCNHMVETVFVKEFPEVVMSPALLGIIAALISPEFSAVWAEVHLANAVGLVAGFVHVLHERLPLRHRHVIDAPSLVRPLP